MLLPILRVDCGFLTQEYITLVHSCVFITTPCALISSYSTAFELKHALTLSKTTRLFVDAKFLKNALSVAKEIGMDLNKIYLVKGEAEGRRSIRSIIRDARIKHIPPVDIRPAVKDTLAYLIFSSGTSGLPKGNLPFYHLPFHLIRTL
jgi:acyl-CoA synthetase (AMP-forming)/AMP-acid ligase II